MLKSPKRSVTLLAITATLTTVFGVAAVILFVSYIADRLDYTAMTAGGADVPAMMSGVAPPAQAAPAPADVDQLERELAEAKEEIRVLKGFDPSLQNPSWDDNLPLNMSLFWGERATNVAGAGPPIPFLQADCFASAGSTFTIVDDTDGLHLFVEQPDNERIEVPVYVEDDGRDLTISVINLRDKNTGKMMAAFDLQLPPGFKSRKFASPPFRMPEELPSSST